MFSNILKLGWKNISRNKKRTFFTVLAITVGITMLIFASSYIEGMMNSATEIAKRMRTGHVRIMTSEYSRLERVMPKEELVLNSEELSGRIGEVRGVELVSQMVKFSALLSKNELNEPGVVMGVDPEIVKVHMGLSEMIISGKYLSRKKKEVIIGKLFAEKMGIKAGDELLLVTTDINYSTYALPFNVSGIFETGYTYMDKHLAFIPIEFAREILDCGNSSHEILVYLKDQEKAAGAASSIDKIVESGRFGESLDILTWQEDEIIGQLMPMAKKVWQSILGIILMIVALVILNTMLMIVMERYQEIGVLKALGLKSKEIFFMIVAEALYIGALGSFSGVIIGSGLSAWLEKTGINFAEMMGKEMWESFDIPLALYGNIIYPDLTTAIVIKSFLFGLFIAILAVLYPAWKSSKMLPAEAFRAKLKV
ncbi:MAG: ABC transporter permease [Candidatus Aminicenantes bacterium]|nr:ABC transporter permease [Candidatus Aminicenantes bacterium]